ncbi:hypothetical protein [Aureimonas sp. Leaf454]|uniref:hypothetical protein n=1 Tax=Aureimonas sp. Leaf454 TaxID=1736381 RepID=UPI0012E38223|nr:hypothetical protein [Aureimonas sp. Leaf454]
MAATLLQSEDLVVRLKGGSLAGAAMQRQDRGLGAAKILDGGAKVRLRANVSGAGDAQRLQSHFDFEGQQAIV